MTARRSSLIGGFILIVAAFVLGLVSFQTIPGIPLRMIEGSTALNQGITFGASALGMLIGIVFGLRGLRGFEEMRIDSDSLVLPVRKLADSVKGRPTRVARSAIQEAILRRNARGIEVVEFRMKTPDGPKSLVFALAWASRPPVFVENLAAWLPVRRDRGWEELWHQWKMGTKR